MANTNITSFDLKLDSKDRAWVVGQDVYMFDGATGYRFDYTNSAVPSNYPYYLDTRSVSISENDEIWVGCAENLSLNDTAVFYIESDDPTKGKSWTFNQIDPNIDFPACVSKIYASPYGNEVLAFISPVDSVVKYYGNSPTFWNDIAGVTGISGPSDLTLSYFNTDNQGWVAGQYLYQTENGGSNWSIKSSATGGGDFFTAVDGNGTAVVAVTNSRYYTYSLNNGSTWSPIVTIKSPDVSSYGPLIDVKFAIAKVFFFYKAGKFVYNNSTFANFFPSGSSVYDILPTSSTALGRINSSWISTVSNRGYAVGASGGVSSQNRKSVIYRSTNLGNTIPTFSLAYCQTGPELYGVYSSPNSVWAVGASGAVLKSLDNGVTWTSYNSGTSETLTSVWFIDANTGWACGENQTIIKSVDGGQTWFPDLRASIPFSDFNDLTMRDSDTGFVFGSSGGIASLRTVPSGGGGFLYSYSKTNDTWTKIGDDFGWPYIHDIKAKGFGGKYFKYFLATQGSGVIEIPNGKIGSSYLLNGNRYISSAIYHNSRTTIGLSDNVNCLDFDENGNLWTGSSSRNLQFYDFNKWSSVQYAQGQIGKYPVALKVRENGHVFLSEINSTNLILHFNGSSSTEITLPVTATNGKFVAFDLFKKNRNVDGVIWGENDLICLYGIPSASPSVPASRIVTLKYDLAKIVASSKVTGATGWNFIEYNKATGPTSAYPLPIANVNKYSWEYPYWQSYQTDYLQYKHPGLDIRNLFLTTKLSDIASGVAGKQSYWNNSPIPDFSDLKKEGEIQEAEWASIFSNLTATTPGFFTNSSGITDFQIYTSAVIGEGRGKKYAVGGYVAGYMDPLPATGAGVNLGKSLTGGSVYLKPTNPSFGASPYNAGYSAGIPGGGSYDFASPGNIAPRRTGFIAVYDSEGRVCNFLTIPGKSTEVRKIVASEDKKSFFTLGSYTGFIEVGDFMWSSSSVTNGPTGAPIGITNGSVVGLTSAYPWIGGTGSPVLAYSNVTWNFTSNFSTYNNNNFRVYSSSFIPLGSVSSTVNYIAITATPVSGSFAPWSNFYTGMVIKITAGPTDAFFRIDDIVSNYPLSGFASGVPVYLMKVSYLNGGVGAINNTPCVFNFYSSYPGYYPIMRSTAMSYSSTESGEGMFIMEFTNDVGTTVSKRNVSNSSSPVYQLKNFRNFVSSGSSATTSVLSFDQMILDCSSDDVVLAFEADATLNRNLNLLVNSWNRRSDIVPENSSISNNLSANNLIGTIVLDKSTFSIRSFSQLNYTNLSEPITALNISTISNTDTLMLTGTSKVNFTCNGVTLNKNSNLVREPFYIIQNYKDHNSVGVTGSFISNFGNYNTSLYTEPAETNSGFLAKSDGFYTLTNQYFGGLTAGSTYFGKNIEPNKYTQYLVTSFISSNNRVDRVIYGDLGEIKVITQTGFGDELLQDFPSTISGSTWGSKPLVTNDDYLIGYLAGATSYSLNLPLQKEYLFKQNLKDGSVNLIGLGNIISPGAQTFGISDDGDIFFSGSNSSTYGGLTGPSWIGSVGTNPNSNRFVFLSKQYSSEVGVNGGQIISRPGTSPWKWCDVHQSDSGMEIPLMCTVFFSNYGSSIYGKQNNKWILKDSETDREILNVKNTPYFIYTFVKAGYYTIYNSVEDAYGNVYEISKNAFITVIDHTIKKPNDINPFLVDSTDYGYPLPPAGDKSDIKSLGDEIERDKIEFMKNKQAKFSSPLIIKDSSDATFNQ